MEKPASDELIEAISNGLEGTTSGPWEKDRRGVISRDQYVRGTRIRRIAHTLATTYYRDPQLDGENDANAAHIARCSPDNIRALIARLRLSQPPLPTLVEADEG